MKKKMFAVLMLLSLPVLNGCESGTFDYGTCIGQFMTGLCLTVN